MIPFVEILIIFLVLNYFLSLFWNTRGKDLIFGILAFLMLFSFAKWLNFPVIEKLMLYLVNLSAIALIIIFQPEIRLILSKISLKGRRVKEVTEFDKFLENLSLSVYRLAERRTGALIVLENQDSLSDYAKKAVPINSTFSSELLESIFTTTTPLHDGAVIIRETQIISAATILPLSDDSSQLSKSMGTRHRAGLGISQLTDCIAIVVSEETGKVSIARDGIITRGVKIDRFMGILRSIFHPPSSTNLQKSTLESFKQMVSLWWNG